MTRGSTVTGALEIDMHTVQTERAMVSVTSMLQRFHMFSTMYTQEGFLARNESCHSSSE